MAETPVGANGSIPLHATVVVSDKQISCQLADEAVVLDLKGGIYYGLSPVACRVWEMIQVPCVVTQIRDSLLEEYEIEKETCTKDLLELLDQLRKWNLIQFKDDNGMPPTERENRE